MLFLNYFNPQTAPTLKCMCVQVGERKQIRKTQVWPRGSTVTSSKVGLLRKCEWCPPMTATVCWSRHHTTETNGIV